MGDIRNWWKFAVVDLGMQGSVVGVSIYCHGSFLNADSTYVRKNKSFHGFGSYGNILVRNRKMYVAPTPFVLAEGTAHRRTLTLPADMPANNGLVEIESLTRREVDRMVAAYNFDLRSNELTRPCTHKGFLH